MVKPYGNFTVIFLGFIGNHIIKVRSNQHDI